MDKVDMLLGRPRSPESSPRQDNTRLFPRRAGSVRRGRGLMLAVGNHISYLPPVCNRESCWNGCRWSRESAFAACPRPGRWVLIRSAASDEVKIVIEQPSRGTLCSLGCLTAADSVPFPPHGCGKPTGTFLSPASSLSTTESVPRCLRSVNQAILVLMHAQTWDLSSYHHLQPRYVT
ncbi:hypothetical protein PG997_004150 [Apiospora hydei]|uniref:Uncharacterized protein n=1 Tax=Apiospora hydei TaxID=1337664 RepID=A0ABR1X1D2_9PEZI